MNSPSNDKLVGHVHVLCKAVEEEFPFAVAWVEVYDSKKNGRRYARRPSRTFYRRGRGGVRHKILKTSFVPV
jgi:hypothetical protein